MKRTEIKNEAFCAALQAHLLTESLRRLYEYLPVGTGDLAVVASCAAKAADIKDRLSGQFNLNRKHVEGRR